MSDSPRSLDQLQRWMQAVITHPYGVTPGIDSDDARDEIDVASEQVESVILPSRQRTSIERLEIYGNAYYARLLECLRGMFPTVVHAVGEEAFDEFAFGYLQACPSQSYTLDRLGDRFADYLQQTRPDRDEREGDDQLQEPDWPDLLIELARLDWTIGEVFDGPGIENSSTLTAEQLLGIAPDRWPQARLVPVPCLRLLAFRFPINDYFSAVRADQHPEIPEPRDTFLALTRREWVVRRLELNAWQYALLAAIVAGQRVEQAIECAAEQFDGETTEVNGDEASWEQFAEELRQAFTHWSAAQLFLAVEFPTD